MRASIFAAMFGIFSIWLALRTNYVRRTHDARLDLGLRSNRSDMTTAMIIGGVLFLAVGIVGIVVNVV